MINKSLSQKIILSKTNSLINKSITEQVKIAKRFVYQILVNQDKSKLNAIWEEYRKKGWDAFEGGDENTAIRYYESIVGIRPETDADLCLILGLLYQNENQDLALKYYKQSIKLKPSDNAQAYMGVGTILKQKGQYENAISCYDISLNSEEDADVYYEKGTCYTFLGVKLQNDNYYTKITYYENALLCFENALKLNRNHTKANNSIIGLYAQLGSLYCMLVIGFDNIDIYEKFSYSNKAIYYLSKTSEDKALGAAYRARGVCNSKLGNKTDAITDFRTAARLGNNDAKEFLSKNGYSY